MEMMRQVLLSRLWHSENPYSIGEKEKQSKIRFDGGRNHSSES